MTFWDRLMNALFPPQYPTPEVQARIDQLELDLLNQLQISRAALEAVDFSSPIAHERATGHGVLCERFAGLRGHDPDSWVYRLRFDFADAGWVGDCYTFEELQAKIERFGYGQKAIY